MFKQLVTSIVTTAAGALAVGTVNHVRQRNIHEYLPVSRKMESTLNIDGEHTGFFLIYNSPVESTLYFKRDRYSKMKEVGLGEAQGIMEFLGEYILQHQPDDGANSKIVLRRKDALGNVLEESPPEGDIPEGTPSAGGYM